MTKDGTALAIDSAQLISSLFALIPIPVARADERGRVVLANSSFGETFQGITDVSTLHHHEIEVPGRGTFDLHTLPLNDHGFTILYAVDVANEAELRRQVVHLEKMAAIGRLVTGVAHELNNPLADIRGYAPLVARCEMDATARRIFDVVFTQASRAGDVVHNLLSLAGKAAPQRVTFDLNEVVRSATHVRGYQEKLNRFDVKIDLDSGLPRTMGDPSQIEQVVLSLLANAEESVSALQRRPGLIEIRTSVRAGAIQLHVADNGFSRDVTRAFDSNQTGVGLSICSEIVKDHKGELYAWSSYGNGSTFTLELPVSNQPGDDQAMPSTFGRSLRDKSIMVIDDEAHITELIYDVLSRYGAKVRIANSGSEAYETLRNNNFDVIICDQYMPGLSGQNLYRLVENSVPGMQRRFLFMTGDAGSGQTKQFFSQAGVQYLKKPFRIHDLLESIESLFNRNQPQGF